MNIDFIFAIYFNVTQGHVMVIKRYYFKVKCSNVLVTKVPCIVEYFVKGGGAIILLLLIVMIVGNI